MKRTLTLKREHLAELTAAELSGVAGAAPPDVTKPLSGFSCPIEDCFVDSYIGMCWTWVC